MKHILSSTYPQFNTPKLLVIVFTYFNVLFSNNTILLKNPATIKLLFKETNDNISSLKPLDDTTSSKAVLSISNEGRDSYWHYRKAFSGSMNNFFSEFIFWTFFSRLSSRDSNFSIRNSLNTFRPYCFFFSSLI